LGVFALYRIAERRFSSWQVGLLASLFLILIPRIFAESCYNSKDIVFMAFFTIGLNTAIIFLRSPNIKTALIHGLVTAITTDVRVMGIVLLVITAGMVLVRFLRRESQLTNSVYALATYFLVTLFIVVALWPWLWVDPFSHIAAAVKSMARYRWYENNLYLGHYVRATNIPWHYILVWIGVTTPFIYLCFGSLGICTVVTKIIKKRLLWSEDQEMQDLLFLGVFVGAIIAVIALKSVLYDGWRQLYFIYPAFIVLAIRGLLIIYQSISRSKIARLLLILFVAVGLCQQAVWIYRNHPLQNVYFNFLNDERKPTQFDMDYWGLSNKEAFRHILSADEREVISVKAVSDNPLFNGLIFLPDKDRKRIVDAVSEDQADYLVNNYRFLNGKPYVPDTAKFAVVYEIHTGGRVILSVLKRVTQ
jgi:hypothetical protein